MTRLFYFSSASYCTVLCISNPMLGTLKAQMDRPPLPAEQKKRRHTLLDHGLMYKLHIIIMYTSLGRKLPCEKTQEERKYPQPSTNLSSPSPSQLKGERSCLVTLNKYTPCNLSKIDHGCFSDRTLLEMSSTCPKETTQSIWYIL